MHFNCNFDFCCFEKKKKKPQAAAILCVGYIVRDGIYLTGGNGGRSVAVGLIPRGTGRCWVGVWASCNYWYILPSILCIIIFSMYLRRVGDYLRTRHYLMTSTCFFSESYRQTQRTTDVPKSFSPYLLFEIQSAI